METAIIRIGNSQGIIIPKSMMSQFKGTKVALSSHEGGILITPLDCNPRKGWVQAFASATRKDKPELDPFEGMENQFDEEEWTW